MGWGGTPASAPAVAAVAMGWYTVRRDCSGVEWDAAGRSGVGWGEMGWNGGAGGWCSVGRVELVCDRLWGIWMRRMVEASKRVEHSPLPDSMPP